MNVVWFTDRLKSLDLKSNPYLHGYVRESWMLKKISCKPFSKTRFQEALEEIRDLTREKDPDVFVPKLHETLRWCGSGGCFRSRTSENRNLRGYSMDGR